MTVWRGWVLPLLKVALLAAVAVALVKIAFFPDHAEPETDAVPSGQIAEPTVAVETGNVVNDLQLQGSVASVPAMPAKAVMAGQLSSLLVSVGQRVNEGETVAVIRTPISAEISDDAGELDAGAAQQYREAAVVAPVAGTVTGVPVLLEQELAVGDTVAQVSTGRFRVTATVAPEQLYALQNRPDQATVSITGGPADLDCTDLTISAESTGDDAAPEQTGESDTGGENASGPALRCMVPDDVTVFDGLSAAVTIAGSRAEDVLVLPVTAVKGRAGEGTVFTLGEDGTPVEQQVTIGLSDGSFVEITKGLAEGDEVLEFLPVDDPTAGESEGNAECLEMGLSPEECSDVTLG